MKTTLLFLDPPDFSEPPGYYNDRCEQRNCPGVTDFAERPAIFKLRATLLLFFVAALLALGTPMARGQSALDGFDPNANGTIRVVVVQPDGKILIGGDFTTLQPNGAASATTRNHIARLNPDGTLDLAFNPNANLNVYAIAVQADGKILAGGDFVDFGDGTPSIGGQIRNSIARLDPTTGQADSWNPNANNRVRAIVVQADGKILAGGDFSFAAATIGGQSRNFIARLDPTTGLADSFNPNANSTVRAIAVQADGKILAGGVFTGIGGVGRNEIARLDPTTGAADSFNPNSNNIVNAIVVQPDGKILVGGVFTGIGGAARNRIARLDPTTGAADSWDPNANSDVDAIAVQSDGKILIGGAFNGAAGIGGTTMRNRIARLDVITGTPDLFNPNANNNVYAIAVQADGKVLLGGDLTILTPPGAAGSLTRNYIGRVEIDGSVDRTFNEAIVVSGSGYIAATALQPDGKVLVGGQFIAAGVGRNNIARFNTAATPDTGFDPSANNDVRSITVQADGRILLGGSFTTLQPNSAPNSTPRNHIARVFADGTLDGTINTGFNPNANDLVLAIAVQGDGKILLGGNFTTLQPNNAPNPTNRSHIARLFSDGTLDTSFNPTANGDVYSIAVQPDGKILVGGTFTTIGGATRNRIARLEPVFGTADLWDPNADGAVYSIAVQSDGKILAGGLFGSIGAGTRNRMARLDATNGSADSFNPNGNGVVLSIAVQANGQILAGGQFTTIGGAGRNRIARLNATNGAADAFDPNAIFEVKSIALQPDGKILAGGAFNGSGITIGGQNRNYLARLTNDTAALQNLSATQSTITWTRGGSSTQFTRVTFESSTDNLNYTFLGNGTASGSNWSLTGLNFATGQSIYIRARGCYRSGYENGSESIAESVRYAFIAPPPTPSAVVSRKLHNGAPFDITLPLTGSPGIECRSGGAGNNYQVVFTFPSAVTFTNAAITTGAGSVSGSSGSGTTAVTVNLTGVTNAQKIMVTLQGASDGSNTGDLSVPLGVLLGDVNGNASVNSTDISQTKLQSGQPATNANFREDVNVSGSINATDVSSVKLKSGTSLPP